MVTVKAWDSDFCILTSVFRPSVSTVPSVRACPPLMIIRSSHLGEVSSEHGSENRKESLYGVHLFRACGGKGRSPSSPVRGPRELHQESNAFAIRKVINKRLIQRLTPKPTL